REIYLKAFEICVKEANPWTIMSSYNIVNGVRASENRELLTDILRTEWGFDGFVTTDWYTHGEQYREINAGNDVKMGCGMPEHTLSALRDGRLSREALEISVRRVLKMLLKLA
ncbi:MAG: glycoside hydrolase family 3 protein, partial [Oscillospiraceae bacterium]|nr:glycoside hydrolase family 3 protein [Oscillospiraceae bacterium]